MKKWMIASALALVPAAVHAQGISNPPGVAYVGTAPSGACNAAPPVKVLSATGAICTCAGGSWSCSGGPVGSISGQASGVIPLATGATVIGAQSHIDDGVTNPGFLTSSEGQVVHQTLSVGPDVVDAVNDWGAGTIFVVDNTYASNPSWFSATPPLPLAIGSEWTPNVDVAANQQDSGIQMFMDANLDGQATTSAQVIGANIQVRNDGTSIATADTIGVSAIANSTGPTTLIGASFQTSADGVFSASDDNGVISRLNFTANASPGNLANYVSQLYASSGTIGNYQGYLFDTNDGNFGFGSMTSIAAFSAEPVNVSDKSTTTACLFCGSTVVGATHNYGIDITGAEINAFGGGFLAVGTQTVSGCSLSSAAGGAWAGSFHAGATACTLTITAPSTAPNGWKCSAQDTTTGADTMHQSGLSTTQCVLTGTVVSNDVIVWSLDQAS